MGVERTEAIVPAEMRATAEAFSYSPGTRSGDWVFVSGQVGRNSLGEVVQDPEAQFVTAFENLGTVLRAAGLSFGHIVDLTTYHTTFEQFPLFVAVKDRYLFEVPHPAWTGVGVSELALPGLLVEIKAVARG
jgi:enamine deaminase RidA (YjgF/YER057c/UK114 family)